MRLAGRRRVACWVSQGWSNVGCAAHFSPAAPPLLLLFEGADIRAMGARRPFAAPRVAGGLASADTNPRAFTGECASYTEGAAMEKRRKMYYTNGVGARRACWRAKMVFSEALR